jgi:SAM-dependent methyltransferase
LQAEIRVAYVTDFQEHLPELVDVPWASIWYPEKRVESIRHKIEEGVALGTYKRDWKVPMTRLTRVSSFPMSIAFNLYRLLGSEGGQELKQREMVVVDPFMGMGIRVVTAIIMGHTAYGYDVAKPMPDKIKKAWKLKDVNEADTGILEIWDKLQHAFYVHDSRSLPHKDNSVDLVFTSPPYWLVEKYEGAVEEGQLSKAKTYAEFMKGMYQAYDEMKRIVKPGGYIALVVANFREKGAYIPYADDTCYYFRSDPQLQYHDKIILGHDLSKPTGGTKSIINNHTRLAHEELFVFKRKK